MQPFLLKVANMAWILKIAHEMDFSHLPLAAVANSVFFEVQLGGGADHSETAAWSERSYKRWLKIQPCRTEYADKKKSLNLIK